MAASESASIDLTSTAAQQYLALATRLNAAFDAIHNGPSPTLDSIKSAFAQRAAVQDQFIAGFAAIMFPPSMKGDVDALLRASNKVRAAEVGIAAGFPASDANAVPNHRRNRCVSTR